MFGCIKQNLILAVKNISCDVVGMVQFSWFPCYTHRNGQHGGNIYLRVILRGSFLKLPVLAIFFGKSGCTAIYHVLKLTYGINPFFSKKVF